ncbi:YggT family protein [Leeia aquatica]|uniref:YggT family protein n=1 Tax=Leeia aquatica TaxID=2725557 RepID=A0A847SGV0_9NEIS|nr:YggT family protein [Leeia aquatica]NLR76488.1 YggT family protein [Leeia aquatica]
MMQALGFILDTIIGFFILVLLLRFSLQCARASFNNPLSQFCISFTNWLVRPLRRVIPGLFGLDLATLVAALLVAWVLSLLSAWILQSTGFTLPLSVLLPFTLGLAVIKVMQVELYLLIGSAFVLCILSWTRAYHHPMAGLLNALVAPLLRPLQRVIPPVSGFDLSPLVLILVLQVILYFALPSLQQSLLRAVLL